FSPSQCVAPTTSSTVAGPALASRNADHPASSLHELAPAKIPRIGVQSVASAAFPASPLSTGSKSTSAPAFTSPAASADASPPALCPSSPMRAPSTFPNAGDPAGGAAYIATSAAMIPASTFASGENGFGNDGATTTNPQLAKCFAQPTWLS